MPDTDPGPAGAEPSQAVLTDVVKGLRDEKELLFGIGAGVVLIGVLAATTSIALVAIVAAVLLLALAAWVYGDARRAQTRRLQPGPRPRVRASLEDAKIRDSDVGNVRDESGAAGLNAELHADRADIKDSRIGNVTIGPVRDEDS